MRYAVDSFCMAAVSGNGAVAGCRCSSIGNRVRLESTQCSNLFAWMRSEKAEPGGSSSWYAPFFSTFLIRYGPTKYGSNLCLSVGPLSPYCTFTLSPTANTLLKPTDRPTDRPFSTRRAHQTKPTRTRSPSDVDDDDDDDYSSTFFVYIYGIPYTYTPLSSTIVESANPMTERRFPPRAMTGDTTNMSSASIQSSRKRSRDAWTKRNVSHALITDGLMASASGIQV